MFLCACFLPACQWPLYTDGGIPLLSNCKFALTMIKWDVLSQNTNVWQTWQQPRLSYIWS
jgi:hypothetical protein